MNAAAATRLAMVVLFLAMPPGLARAESNPPAHAAEEETAAFQKAAAYSKWHGGLAMVVMKDGAVIFEDYAKGIAPDRPLNLYSGTKSFACAISTAAAQNGLLELDEPVAKTIGEWQGDPAKARITIRHLLSLTSGLDAGSRGSIPTYAEALQAKVKHEPGAVFEYGPVPYQIFGEVMSRKLHASGENPLDYLKRRILAPAGLTIGEWRMDKAGNPRMPAGAFLTAREWGKYGQLMLDRGRWGGTTVLDEARLAECFNGSAANPGYGLTFWLPTQRNGIAPYSGKSTDHIAAKLLASGAHGDIIEAAGRGGQKLYIMPSQRLVIVRFANRWSLWTLGFRATAFLGPVLQHYAQ